MATLSTTTTMQLVFLILCWHFGRNYYCHDDHEQEKAGFSAAKGRSNNIEQERTGAVILFFLFVHNVTEGKEHNFKFSSSDYEQFTKSWLIFLVLNNRQTIVVTASGWMHEEFACGDNEFHCGESNRLHGSHAWRTQASQAERQHAARVEKFVAYFSLLSTWLSQWPETCLGATS